MHAFSAPVTVEGSGKKGLRVTIPQKVAKAAGLGNGGWARFSGAGSSPLFLYARRPPSRTSVEVGLPVRVFPLSLGKQVIECAIESAEPYRASDWTDQQGFDWLPLIPPQHYFPTEKINGRILLHNRYEEPFELKRVTALEPTYRLLGWYQAEGSKGRTAMDFSFANTNPLALKFYAEQLSSTWGLSDRLALSIIRNPNSTEEQARDRYKILNMMPVAERIGTPSPRSKKGEEPAGLIQVRKSTPLLRLTRAALSQIFETKEWPSKEAAKAYAFGWLDGDGNIVIDRRSYNISLRFAGYEDEQKIVLSALEHAFDVQLPGGKFGTPLDCTSRSLRLDIAARLAIAGVFPFSLNRARLIWALAQRLTRGPNGLTSPEHYKIATDLFKQLEKEANALNKHPLAAKGFNTGKKGLTYPVF